MKAYEAAAAADQEAVDMVESTLPLADATFSAEFKVHWSRSQVSQAVRATWKQGFQQRI